jgi:hypothetical protein
VAVLVLIGVKHSVHEGLLVQERPMQTCYALAREGSYYKIDLSDSLLAQVIS